MGKVLKTLLKVLKEGEIPLKTIFLMAGTSEGRLLTEHLLTLPLHLIVTVTTPYAATLLPSAKNLTLLIGKRDTPALERLLRTHAPLCAIDATHPYAVTASEHLRAACKSTFTPYHRIARPSGIITSSNAICLPTPEQAAFFLRDQPGTVLLTTGSNTLALFAPDHALTHRYFARVLPLPQVLEKCAALGFTGRHVIAMQGPFSAAYNTALLREIGASWLVTKESGDAGGFAEKLTAAKEAGARPLIITRSPEPGEALSAEAFLTQFKIQYESGDSNA